MSNPYQIIRKKEWKREQERKEQAELAKQLKSTMFAGEYVEGEIL